MNEAAAMLDATYEDPTLGVDVIWTPKAGGGPFLLRGLRGGGDQVANIDMLGGVITASDRLRLRVSEVELRAPGVRPAKDDRFEYDGRVLHAISPPRLHGRRRLQWAVELAK